MTEKGLDYRNRLRNWLHNENGEPTFLADVHEADLAEALESLTDEERVAVFRRLGAEQAAEVLGELPTELQARIVETLNTEMAGAIIEEMADDDAADLLAELTPQRQGELLGELEAKDADDVRDLLRYDPETAGGRMTTDIVRVTEHVSAQAAIEHLRRVGPDAESIYYVYVTDRAGRLVGVLSLRDVIVASPGETVRNIMRTKVVTVAPDTDEEEIARVVAKYNLLAVPVVGPGQELLGMVTVDDVLDMVEKIRAEELLRVVGSDAMELEHKRPIEVAKARLPWLLGTLLLELLAGTVIHRFDDTLAHVILLASFMPIISALSGNVGLQSATIVVRGLATGVYSPTSLVGPLWREVRVDIIMGLVLGIVLAVIGWVWSGTVGFGLVVGVSLQASMLTAGFMGTVIPVLSKRLGFDPAVTAGPFETAFQDVIGFGVFLSLATALLPLLT
jgi:magnesium transporter